MKISDETIELLGNFCTINSGIVIPTGSAVRTISESKSLIAIADAHETFPCDFSVYDLQEFLETTKLFTTPVFDFSTSKKHVAIKEDGGKQAVKYFYADKDTITHTDKTPKIEDFEIEFNLEDTKLAKVLKAAAVLRVDDIAISSNDDIIQVVVKDKQNPTSNAFTIDVGDNTGGAEFEMFFKLRTLKMYPGSYKFNVSKQFVAKVEAVNPIIANELTYFVAMEQDGSYKV